MVKIWWSIFGDEFEYEFDFEFVYELECEFKYEFELGFEYVFTLYMSCRWVYVVVECKL